MVHRAILGSLERFVGHLIEHFGGEFPVWFAPVQVAVIPANPKAYDYALDTVRLLKEGGVRATTDLRDEKMGAKIRDAELEKIPYMLVVGPREAEAGTVLAAPQGRRPARADDPRSVPGARAEGERRAHSLTRNREQRRPGPARGPGLFVEPGRYSVPPNVNTRPPAPSKPLGHQVAFAPASSALA